MVSVLACATFQRREDRNGTLRFDRRLLRKRPSALWRGVLRRRRARARIQPQPAPARHRRRAGLARDRFAPYCSEVVGVDPEPAMVEAARSAGARAGVTVEFIDGRFEDLAAGLGAFDVVTIGRAIHWLDPSLARTALDRVVKPLGRILVCHASSVDDGRNPWLGAFKAIRNLWRD